MVILSPQLGISPTATTGGETYDREVLKCFVKLGERVKILLPKGKTAPVELENAGIERASIGHFVPSDMFNMFAWPWVLRQLKVHPPAGGSKFKIPILRIHSPEYLFWTAYLTKKLHPEIPVVAHYHLDQTGKLWTMMNRKLLNIMDAVIADSEYLKKQLIERVGVDERLIHVIHCGVDIDKIKPRSYKRSYKGLTSRRGQTLSDEKTILFLGRFVERKRPDFAIEVFAKLHGKYPNTKLIMVGEGPLQQKLQLQVTSYKLQDFVEFPGPLFGEEKLKRYHETDLFLFPSEKEGFVLVVLEAMAAGLPLLVPNSMGFAEAVSDGKNGFLAISGNVDDWVSKAEKILFDDALNISMRKISREIAVRRFSWERCAEENLKIYRWVVQ